MNETLTHPAWMPRCERRFLTDLEGSPVSSA
jgi:hypothetical protein